MSNEELILELKSRRPGDRGELMLELFNNCKSVINTAIKPFLYYSEPDDVRQEAFLALYSILEKYDPDRAKFTTYIIKMMPGIVRARLDAQRGIKIPTAHLERMRAYGKELRELELELGHPPTEAEIVEGLRIHPEALRLIQKDELLYNPVSLDMPVDEEDGATLADLQTGAEDPAEAIVERDAAEKLETELTEALAELEGDTQRAIIGVYVDEKSLKELADADGVSHETIRQRREKGLRQIRQRHGARLRALWSEGAIFSAALHGTGLTAFREDHTSSVERVAFKILGENDD